MKKANLFIVLFFLFFFTIPFAASAYEVKTGNTVTIEENETIVGNLYTTASNLTINGLVEGDLFCAASNLTINGEVEGDVICAANTVSINGPINGSVRVLGNTVTINNSIEKNLQSISTFTILNKDATVGWDMFVGGESVELSGLVGGDLHGGVGQAIISGEVEGSVKLKLDNSPDNKEALTINPGAIIGENVYYIAGAVGTIAEEAQINGEIKHSFYGKEKNAPAFWLFFGTLASVFAALVVGLVLISLARKPLQKIISIMKNEAGSSFGFGALALFLTPLIAIVLMVTIIGLPLAIIILLLWALMLYLSKIIFGIFIGNYILKNFVKKESKSLIWSMIVGVVIVWIICEIPFIGWLFCLVSVLWSFGAVLLYLKKNSDQF